jgi:putative addiction module CopG family antidote
MEIRLSPEVAAVVEADVAAGRFASAEEYVAAAVELLHEREGWKEETVEGLNASLEAAIAEADRDGWLDEAEVRRRMSEMKAEWAARRSA